MRKVRIKLLLPPYIAPRFTYVDNCLNLPILAVFRSIDILVTALALTAITYSSKTLHI